jgi:hypothetical protein
MSIPQPPLPSQGLAQVRAAKTLRRAHAIRRTRDIHISVTPETKARFLEAGSKLLMNSSEFFEWLMDHYARGLVIVLEEGAFLEGLSQHLDRRTDQRAEARAEKTVLRVLYDLGLVDSPHPR